MTWREGITEARERLLSIGGIGPWTASYIALRALGDVDASMDGDLGIRQLLGSRCAPASRASASRAVAAWTPYRGYAAVHAWTSLLLSH
jgi:AraC family transcriptional regulator of adaptative response / DNA-3-methyladenine glycosylase II